MRQEFVFIGEAMMSVPLCVKLLTPILELLNSIEMVTAPSNTHHVVILVHQLVMNWNLIVLGINLRVVISNAKKVKLNQPQSNLAYIFV